VGKTVLVEVEVIDATLDYNFILGHTWFYTMKVVASSVFQLVKFPHQGKIITVDQLDFCTPDVRINPNVNVPFIGESSLGCESIRVGLYPSLMGNFPLPPPEIPQPSPSI
jgi:hypothetical protein